MRQPQAKGEAPVCDRCVSEAQASSADATAFGRTPTCALGARLRSIVRCSAAAAVVAAQLPRNERLHRSAPAGGHQDARARRRARTRRRRDRGHLHATTSKSGPTWPPTPTASPSRWSRHRRRHHVQVTRPRRSSVRPCTGDRRGRNPWIEAVGVRCGRRASAAVMRGRSAVSRRSPCLGRGADRRGCGRSAPWRAAGCRASIRRA